MPFDKKQLEILLINYFRETYAGFPKGILKTSESPDFILMFKNRRQLGIELTRLNPGNAIPPNGDERKKIESGENLIGHAKDLFGQSSPLKLFVKFLFSDKTDFSAEREMMMAVQLANIVRQTVKDRKADGFFKISVPANQLPEGIGDLLIINHPALEVSVWERSNNLGVSNDIVDDIRTSIRKKDKKLGLYQKQRLNYYWLLIFSDRVRGVRNFNLSEKIINHKFTSRFQHVFLFDLIKSDIYELI
jgi:hypothetical protein